MSTGVKFPDIIRHENDFMAAVDSNDIRGIYVSDVTFAEIDLSTISSDRRRKSFLLSCFNAVYQYVGEDLSDRNWTNKDLWRPVQGAFADGENYIKIIRSSNEISRTCGSETPYVACFETGVIYKYVQDASDYRGIGEGKCIDTKDGGDTGYVDISYSDYYLVKNKNLSDVDDRQTAIDNLCIPDGAQPGQYLYFDGTHMIFKTLPDIMTIKGRVDTVEDLYDLPDVSVGDVYLVGPEGSMEDYEEYVCLFTEGSEPEWECLGKKASEHPWTFDGDYNSIKLYNHGLVSDGSDDPTDTVQLDGVNGTSFSAQNVTQGVESLNTVTFASDGVNVGIINNYYKSENNVVFGSDNISIKNSNNVTISSSSDVNIINFKHFFSGGGSSEGNLVSVEDGLNNIFFTANKGNNNTLYISSAFSIYGANDFNGRWFEYTNNEDPVSVRNIILGNLFDSQSDVHLRGSSNAFINNKISGYVYTDQGEDSRVFDNNIFIGNETNLINTFGLVKSTFISSKIITGNRLAGSYISMYDSYACDFSIDGSNVSIFNSNASLSFSIFGNYNMLVNSNASGFTISGNHNSVDTCNCDGGVIGDGNIGKNETTEYNKIFASEVHGSSNFSYSTIQASNIGGGTWNRSVNNNTVQSEKLFIAATNFSGYNIGYIENNTITPAIYSSIISSNANGLYLYGNYNTYISGKGGSDYLYGEYNTIISGNYSNNVSGYCNIDIASTGTYISGYSNTIMSSIGKKNEADWTATGNNNVLGSTISSSITGNNNTMFSSYGCMLYDEVADGSDTIHVNSSFNSVLSSSDIRITSSSSYISVISCPGQIFDTLIDPRYLGYTLYTNNLRANVVHANQYIGAMSFVGVVPDYYSLPSNSWNGAVYKVDSMTEVYLDGSEGGSGSEGSNVPIGYYPAGTCFVYNNGDWMSFCGVIYYATNSQIDAICQ